MSTRKNEGEGEGQAEREGKRDFRGHGDLLARFASVLIGPSEREPPVIIDTTGLSLI